jgi:hypothetical protein
VLSSPGNQAVGQSPTPTLSWQAAAGATSYTLYLDTVNPPVQHYTVAGTSFTPSAALQGSDLYYWYVVGNSGSISGPASAMRSFWVDGAATAVSVSPASGGPPATGLGTPTTFTFTFASPNGWQDIAWTEMEFNYYNVGSGACFIGYWPNSGQVALMSDNASAGWLWMGNLGQAQAMPGNSQCSVDLAHSSMTPVSPAAIQVTLVITFLAGLPGPQQVWMQAGDSEGDAPVWQQLGAWTTSAVSAQGPSAVSGTMPGQPGAGGTFTYRASSPNGWAYLTQLVPVFDTAGASLYPAPHACYVDYNRLTNNLTLMSDATGQWDSTAQQTQMGSGPAIQNSQCAVSGAGSSAQALDANTLQLNLAVTFNQGWVGSTRSDYLWVWDRAMNGAGWLTVGTYAINNPAVTVTSWPVGQTVTVDGVGYTTPRTFSWAVGTGHSVSAPGAITGTGMQGAFSGWSDSGAAAHNITVGVAGGTYTASYTVQYLLTTGVTAPHPLPPGGPGPGGRDAIERVVCGGDGGDDYGDGRRGEAVPELQRDGGEQ